MNTISKVPVKLVILDRAEGPSDECVSRQFDSIEDAEAQLYRWARTAPEHGNGYNKVDFKVCWEDGEEYEGRYDMNRQGEDDVIGHSLLRHIASFLAFLEHKPKCQGFFKKHPANAKEPGAKDAHDFLNKYIPDGYAPKSWWCCEHKEGK